jgi:hypothetical protein
LGETCATAGEHRTEATGDRSQRRITRIIAAVVVVVLGLVSSVFAANSVARDSREKSLDAVRFESADISSNLQLAIEREQDLIVSAGGFIAGNPTSSSAAFSQWASSVHALDRYPELTAMGEVAMVPAADVSAFAARLGTDPLVAPRGPFTISPPGNRPYYCLGASGIGRSSQALLPAGLDYCSVGLVRSVALGSRLG